MMLLIQMCRQQSKRQLNKNEGTEKYHINITNLANAGKTCGIFLTTDLIGFGGRFYGWAITSYDKSRAEA